VGAGGRAVDTWETCGSPPRRARRGAAGGTAQERAGAAVRRPVGTDGAARTGPGQATAAHAPALPRHVRVAIIGAGFGGLGAGIRLRQAGMTDFVILERAASVGGTWRDNTYPGCACDIPSHLYSFSFAPNPDWAHRFSRQPEIWDYLEEITGH